MPSAERTAFLIGDFTMIKDQFVDHPMTGGCEPPLQRSCILSRMKNAARSADGIFHS
jgi:hypothetical protein